MEWASASEEGVGERAARLIEAGRVVAVQTRRWYMLACSARSETAVDRIYAAKERPRSKALLLWLPDVDTADRHGHLGAAGRDLAEAFWPGDLALRLPARGSTGPTGEATVLCSVEAGIATTIAACAEVPVVATSANVSGDPYPTGRRSEVEDLDRRAGGFVDLAVGDEDGGLGQGLTIVDVTGAVPRLERPGAVQGDLLDSIMRTHGAP